MDHHEHPRDLQERWAALTARFPCGRDVAGEVFGEIAQAYSSPARRYHTLDHVRAMFTVLDGLVHLIAHPDAVAFAVWFHDVVYNTYVDDNEQQSASYALDALQRIGAGEGTAEHVVDLVLTTKTHQPLGVADAEYLIDADLAVLGSPAAEYDVYRAAIRAEYAWVVDEQFRRGRAAVLRGFLARPRIYLTERMFAGLEHSARANLQRELQELAGTEGPG